MFARCRAPPYLRIKGCLHLPGEFRRLPRGPVILEPSHPLTGVTCIYFPVVLSHNWIELNFVSISRSLRTREIPANSEAFICESSFFNARKQSWFQHIKPKPTLPQRGENAHSRVRYEYEIFNEHNPTREPAAYSLPRGAKRFAVEVIKGSSILVNPSQPSIEPSADVALTEAIYLFSSFLHSLCPRAVCKRIRWCSCTTSCAEACASCTSSARAACYKLS